MSHVTPIPIEVILEHVCFYTPVSYLQVSRGLRRAAQKHILEAYERQAGTHELSWLALLRMTLVPRIIPERHLVFSMLLRNVPLQLELDEEIISNLTSEAIRNNAYECLDGLLELANDDCEREEITYSITIELEEKLTLATFEECTRPPLWVLQHWFRTPHDREELLMTVAHELVPNWDQEVREIFYWLVKDGWTGSRSGCAYVEELMQCPDVSLVKYAVLQYQGSDDDMEDALTALAIDHAWDHCHAIMSTGRFYNARVQRLIDNRFQLDKQKTITDAVSKIQRVRERISTVCRRIF